MPIKVDVRYKSRDDLRYDVMVRTCEKKHPFMHPSDVVSFLRIGEQMTQKQTAKYLGVSVTTIRTWQKPEAQIHIYTEKERQVKRRSAIRLNELADQGLVKRGKKWRNEFETTFFGQSKRKMK